MHRRELTAARDRSAAECPKWDKRVCVAQVTDLNAVAMQVRLLMSAKNAGDSWDLQ